MTRRQDATRGPSAQSIGRALDIVFFLATARRPLTVAEIVEGLKIPQSTVYRLIKVLEERGLLQRRHGKVELGLRLLDLARVVYHQLQRDLLRFASPIVAQLAALTGEAAVLMGRVGVYAICLTSADSPRPIRMAFERGQVLPLYRGASNKALLAFLPERVIAEVLEHAQREDPDLDLEALQAELAEIRRRGYSITTGELDPGATAIGAPVLDAQGVAIASLSVAGPTERLKEHLAEHTSLTVRAARRLSEQLGWAGTWPHAWPGDGQLLPPTSTSRERMDSR